MLSVHIYMYVYTIYIYTLYKHVCVCIYIVFVCVCVYIYLLSAYDFRLCSFEAKPVWMQSWSPFFTTRLLSPFPNGLTLLLLLCEHLSPERAEKVKVKEGEKNSQYALLFFSNQSTKFFTWIILFNPLNNFLR